MYKYLMIIGVSIVAIGWIAYGIYNYIAGRRERNTPKQRSERYQQAQKSMSEYAKKMADFEKNRCDEEQ